MALHGGTPHERTRPTYERCPHCGKKGFWRYFVGGNPTRKGTTAGWHVTRCRYCGHYAQERLVNK